MLRDGTDREGVKQSDRDYKTDREGVNQTGRG